MLNSRQDDGLVQVPSPSSYILLRGIVGCTNIGDGVVIQNPLSSSLWPSACDIAGIGQLGDRVSELGSVDSQVGQQLHTVNTRISVFTMVS